MMRRYLLANRYVNEGLIRRNVAPQPAGPTRREWMLRLLDQLDHPEHYFSAIHVGGTSGKGSVCTMIAHILRAARIRTGLHVSPYVQVATEKLWVDGRYAHADEYTDLVDWIRPHMERWRDQHAPLHGVASVAICLEHFRRQSVDVGVVEVGVGGRDDLTNVLDAAVAVVTNVGLDHQRTLGTSLDQIAEHKVGIIHPGCRAVVFAQDAADPLCRAATRRASATGATLRIVGPEHVSVGQGGQGRCRVTFRGRHLGLQDAEVAMTGLFQGVNAAIALAACEEFDPSGELIGEEDARQGLRTARLPARLELIEPGSSVIGTPLPCRMVLDGAHNADKLAVLTRHLLDDNDGPRRIHLVYGALDSKTHQGAAAELARLATSATITEPQVYGKQARPAAELAQVLSASFDGPVQICPDPIAAMEQTLDRARQGDWVVVTGSLYLAGNLRARWFPDEEIVAQRTSWPNPRS